jgi:hypothetical protein
VIPPYDDKNPLSIEIHFVDNKDNKEAVLANKYSFNVAFIGGVI